ncbi:proline-rich receptor-like protein kinase PERK2 [Iris pallida]|uniref:Proline-rich receptor-like protein kinase PERK2 n=1 Tax=Iris pallida TaxID=29817 RepID=A0AAX6HL47_IRIPA|nr:proline-rich receptor-like protein kinase PERK2 [Iris pallida]KAJ6847770.1 proline-rich receptor-like protein kinase PERK2 [Iris pallida]
MEKRDEGSSGGERQKLTASGDGGVGSGRSFTAARSGGDGRARSKLEGSTVRSRRWRGTAQDLG